MSRHHNFSTKFKNLSFHYCNNCGLILLNNKATKKAAQRACEDPTKAAPEWIRNAKPTNV